MRHKITSAALALILVLPVACAAPQPRETIVRVDDDFYTVTETRKPGGLFSAGEKDISARVKGQDVACAALPCAAEIRTARATLPDAPESSIIRHRAPEGEPIPE